jgi:hypothetical protein
MVQPANKRLVTEATVAAHVATQITTPGTPTATALNATYAGKSVEATVAAKADKTELTPIRARTVLGPRVVFLGDSITIGDVTYDSVNGNQNNATAWPTYAVASSSGAMSFYRNAGIAGQRSDQMLARFDTDVTPYAPDVVVLTSGTNNVLQGTTLAAWQTDVQAFVAECGEIGARPVFGAIYPNASNAATIATWNAWLYDYAAGLNIPVIPFDRLADPATGGWPATWTADGTHPTLLNAPRLIGEFAWSYLAPLYGPPALKRAFANGMDSLTNGFFTTAGASTAAPTGSATNSTASGTLPAGTYSYKATARSYFGESLPSAEISSTLSGVGTVTVTVNQVTGQRGHNLYRKAPGDSNWYLVAQTTNSTGNSTFTDSGAYTPGAALVGTDTSNPAAGVNNGAASYFASGFGVGTDAAIRGKYLRITPYTTNTDGYVNLSPTNLTMVPDEVWEVSALMRSNDLAKSTLRMVWLATPGGSATGGLVNIVDAKIGPDWKLVQGRFKVRSNAGGGYLRVLNTYAAGSYTDIAEVTLRKVS